jgi:ribonuclease M5
MEKLIYQQIIVVEGIHDQQKLESIFPGIECIVTNGSSVNDRTIEAIKRAQEERGVILFLDPDFPGKKISNFIFDRIEGLNVAIIKKSDAISKNKKKVGIEHASEKSIKAALDSIICVKSTQFYPISQKDLRPYFLFGYPDSQTKRDYLCDQIGLPRCNGKALIKWINRLHIPLNRIEEVLS